MLMLASIESGVDGQSRTVGAFFDEFGGGCGGGPVNRRRADIQRSRQDRLDRQLTPETPEWRGETVEQARRGLRELARGSTGHV